ncbi:type I restriction enzyme HsdR N-terminal domain-containing protein [Brevibacillus humidisoli]|uniref:type I restriction endonuclease n=1 Tax=Brevibacillus humidisoli TaxID=2895522 RepID=UPI001E5AB06F|nr:type I restriction endonuclease [Brevibacillus humidisoli]UFJ41779.1 type I restriction enzyme HsdR N-terminal domain-containing protein [Brevibacillus humidisoli]
MGNFPEVIKTLSKRVQKIKNNIATEEATKTSIIMPFFQALNYDIFNPEEFLPEYVADVGIKKGEKVDYAILRDGEPVILVEAKSINETINKHDSQLFRYFGTTKAKFAILTNGIHYRFYTDLEEQNKMDKTPFFEFNLLEIRENQINELYKFRKENFDIENILTTASELKYTSEIKQFLAKQWENPTDDFVSFILSDIYPGKKTKQVLEKFNGVVKKSLKQFVSDMLNDKLKAALANTEPDSVSEEDSSNDNEEIKNEPQIVTTEEEIEGYVTVKLLLKDNVEPERVFYRDNLSYFNVLLDNNIRKWICRLGLSGSNKYIQFNDDSKSTVSIDRVSDIQNHKDKLIEVTKKFI